MIPKVPSEDNNVTHRLEYRGLTGILATIAHNGATHYTLVRLLAVRVCPPMIKDVSGGLKLGVKALVQVDEPQSKTHGVKAWVDYDLIHEVA